MLKLIKEHRNVKNISKTVENNSGKKIINKIVLHDQPLHKIKYFTNDVVDKCRESICIILLIFTEFEYFRFDFFFRDSMS